MQIINNNKTSRFVLYASLLVFIAFATTIFYINREMLYTAHDRSEFLYGTPFLQTLLSKPFGLMQYAGAWLTQLFYYPALGAGVLMLIWLLIFFAGKEAFRLHGNASALMLLPVACLLTSIVDLGYWVYILPVRGYYFSQSLGYLITLLLLWIARSTPRKWHLLWYIIGFCIYPVLGWFAILFVICLALTEKPSWRELCGFLLILMAASVWRTLIYSNLKIDEVLMAGMPHIKNLTDNTEILSLPFWLIAVFSVLFLLRSRYFENVYVPVLCTIAALAFTSSFMYCDENYYDEMRMVRFAEEDNWQKVIEVAEKAEEPTNTIIMLKNIALMNEGGLLDRSFMIVGNEAFSPYNPDSVHVSLLEIASPLVYYNYGMQNEAIRLNYECAVQGGFSPFYLKMLARSTFATNEPKLMNRFITLLHHHPFYTNWQPAMVSDKVKELQSCYPDEITGVENSDNYLVNSISGWYESDSKLAAEQALFYSMIRRDHRRFWPALRKYFKTHDGEAFPIHAQEAYILFLDRAPEEKRMMVPVEDKIYERYQEFWDELEERVVPGVKLAEVGEEMKKKWGNTYWYYNIFVRKTY